MIQLLAGPELPEEIENAAMVTSPNGKGVILIGGNCERENDSEFESIFYGHFVELKSNRKEWVEFELEDYHCWRNHHLAIPFPFDKKERAALSKKEMAMTKTWTWPPIE